MSPPAPEHRAPLLSVIVPTRNCAALLSGALQSMSMQTSRDFEVVVSDGGSSDETIDVARRYEASLPAMTVDSRLDLGVYDAINRGVALSRGEWFLVLGADDRIHAPDTLARMAEHLVSAHGISLVHGDVLMLSANHDGVPPGGRFAGRMTLQRLFSSNICQQSIFYRRSLFQSLGGFDLRYPLYADWAFNLRAAFAGPIQWVDVVVSDYSAQGISASNVDRVFLEEMPALIRDEFLRQPRERSLWPLQRRLIHDANALRKKGRWRDARASLMAYGALLWHRLPAIAQGGN